ncbi:hypothetical protein GCM10010467_17750 [Actinocorallia glomerata]|uniref:Uncharacterized protein n=2 Tax=Actinomycetes TaxID=1760 RepID=A0ABP6M1S1_9MICC
MLISAANSGVSSATITRRAGGSGGAPSGAAEPASSGVGEAEVTLCPTVLTREIFPRV